MAELILIVDDDPDIRTFLEISLSLHGFEILEAHDGQQALELAQEHRPALILMDVMMPNIDGLEALRRLRAHPRTGDIPVLLVTAKAQGADKVAGLAEGADDYITKPFDVGELVARVRSVLRRAQQMRDLSLSNSAELAGLLTPPGRRTSSTNDIGEFLPSAGYGFCEVRSPLP